VSAIGAVRAAPCSGDRARGGLCKCTCRSALPTVVTN